MVARGTDVKAVESDVFTVEAPTAPAVAPVTVQSTTYDTATSTLTVNVDKNIKGIVNGKVSIATNKGTTLYDAELPAVGKTFKVVVGKEDTINGGELKASVVLEDNTTVDLKGTIKY
ncbi:hypothetical protein GNF85_19700 [Clostridium perfringens]